MALRPVRSQAISAPAAGLARPITSGDNLAAVKLQEDRWRGDTRVASTLATQQLRQEALEKKLVQELRKPTCPSAVAGPFDMKELNTMLQEQYFDPDYIQMALCATYQDQQAYYRLDPRYHLSWGQHIRAHIRHMRRIGAQSVMGIAMAAEYDTVPAMFIVKTTADIERGAEGLRHEFLVAQYGTNALRFPRQRQGRLLPAIPNFSIVFFGFGCAPTLIAAPDEAMTDAKHQPKEALGYCNGSGSVEYAGYENIRDAIDSGDAIPAMTDRELRQTYLQYLYAAQTAYEECRFTHYDLHSGNIRLRKVPGDEVLLHYVVGGRDVYLTAPWVVTFIDYGEAFIQIDGQPLGAPSPTGFIYGRQSTQAFPLYDAYKFLLSLAQVASLDDRADLLPDLEVALRYWNPQAAISEAIGREAESFYSLAGRPDLVGQDLLGLIRYLEQHWDVRDMVYSSPPTAPPRLECGVDNTLCSRQPTETKAMDIATSHPGTTDLLTAADEYSFLEPSQRAAYLATLPLTDLVVAAENRILEEYEWLVAHYDHVRDLLRPQLRAPDPSQRIDELYAAATYIFEELDLRADIAALRRAFAILTADGGATIAVPELDRQEADLARTTESFTTRLRAELQATKTSIPDTKDNSALRSRIRNLEALLVTAIPSPGRAASLPAVRRRVIGGLVAGSAT